MTSPSSSLSVEDLPGPSQRNQPPRQPSLLLRSRLRCLSTSAMSDLDCPYCKSLFVDPVLLDAVNCVNACRQCAIKNIVGKGAVSIPGSTTKITVDTPERLRPNVTLGFLLRELQNDDDIQEKIASLLDSLSLFSVVGFDPVPCDVEKENSVDLVIQAPERFSTFVDLVAVVDFSASMKGAKIALLKETLRYFINNLDENDRFGVVGFASEVSRVFEIEAATAANKAKWIEKLSAPEPKNKSNIAGGLLEGIEMLANLRGRRTNSTLVVFTDGQATKGVVEEDQILAQTKSALQKHNLRISIHTFGYRKHQVNLMRKLSEIYTGQYFFIQNPIQIPESLAISFTDIRRCHFHDISLTINMFEGCAIRQIGTRLPVGPIPGTTSMKRGCVVSVNQLSERRQKNILFRITVPKAPGPISNFPLLTASLSYIDSSLSLKRKSELVVTMDRPKLHPAAEPSEKHAVTTQWNRVLTGTTIEQAAMLGRDSQTKEEGVTLVAKALEAVKRNDQGEQIDNESASVFYNTLKKSKKILEKHSALDDSNFGKMMDMANAFLNEQSSVFVDAYHTEAVDLALQEIKENTKSIQGVEDEEGDDDDDKKGKVPSVPPPAPGGLMKFPKGKGLSQYQENDPTRFRLNTYKQFKTLKDQQLSELLSKLKRGKLTPQEIEARLERAKRSRQDHQENELQRRLRLQREKSEKTPYKTLRNRSVSRLPFEGSAPEEEIPNDVEFTHQALYDFDARTTREIDLRAGDPLVFIKQKESFAEVENLRTKKTGLVPYNYLAIVLIGDDSSISFATHQAIYDFKPRNDQEISLKVGDEIKVTLERNDGFFEGINTRTDEFGLFPSTHVSPKVTHIATSDFHTGLSTEVELKVGDGIIVTKFRDDGWVQGQNVRTGAFGLMPSSFVTKATKD